VAPQRLAAAAMTPEQDYLLQAWQMQALSFSVHIPLVCFGSLFRHYSCSWSGCICEAGTRFTGRSAQMDERDGRAVCRRCGDWNDSQLQDGGALAGVHRDLRRCLRARLRPGGLLVLPEEISIGI
jgi:hypothetical protein